MNPVMRSSNDHEYAATFPGSDKRTAAMKAAPVRALLKMVRPLQWLKNLMVYFPPFLGGALFLPETLRLWSLMPFAAFCLASSAAYILNDMADRDSDARHPEKSQRPIPSGQLSLSLAAGVCSLLTVGACAAAWLVSLPFLWYLLAYLLVSTAYSLRLKDYTLVDIFCISAGFVLRLQAGGAAFGIAVSEWLFLSVFLLSLFLSTGKRLAEKRELGAHAAGHRKALDGYPPGYLEMIMQVTAGAVLVTYTMYVISRHSALLLISVPLCCFGLFRYMLRIHNGKSGDPTESLTRDVPLLLVGLVWVVLVGWGIYGR